MAIVVSSFAMLALASLSLTIVGGNKQSKHAFEAIAVAQDTMEGLRYSGFNLGLDATLGTSDDTVPSVLTNSSTSNDTAEATSTLFASPDHAFALDSNGKETSTVLDSPTLSISSNMRRAWTIRDNYPSAGMKTIAVVVGWKEGTANNYVFLVSAMQGK